MILTATFMDSLIGNYSSSYELFKALDTFTPAITDSAYPIIKQDTPELWYIAEYILLDTAAGPQTIQITVTSL